MTRNIASRYLPPQGLSGGAKGALPGDSWEGEPMAHVPAFYSSKTKDVHHVCSLCTVGNNIEKHYLTQGTGGLPMCQTCRQLMDNKKC